MFLKQLWIYNKKLLLVFVLAALAWGYINYKQGAVAAPLFQYGMFSGKFFINDTQQVIRLYVNDSMLDFTKYSMSQRDMLQASLDDYIHQKNTNEAVYNSMKGLLNKIDIGKWMSETYYSNTVTDAAFTQWYKKLVEKIVGYKVAKLDAYMQNYSWQTNQLIPVGEPLKINCLAAN